MPLALTPERIAAVYECLRAFPPFSRWGLPPASEVEFHIMGSPETHGDYYRVPRTDRRVIRISHATVGHFETLARTMAHEMVHMRQDKRRVGLVHNKDFRRIAEMICRNFGWDAKAF